MKKLINKIGIWFAALALVAMSSCEDLTEINKNPNAVSPEDAKVNLMLPAILGPTATRYLNLGIENMAGAMQMIQRTGWAGSINELSWDAEGWEGYYDVLRNNKLMMEIAEENDYTFHKGVALTIRAFIFGQIADYWGDAPYSEALQGDEGGEFMFPAYDSQETIYEGVIADLEEAASLFATGDDFLVDETADIYFDGDIEAWERFANSLAIRYLVRVSPKKSDSQSKVEAIVASGKYIQNSEQDAAYDYTGGQNDLWPLQYDTETSSTRNIACKTFIDQLNATNDPRRELWFAPVAIRWVEDGAVSGEDTFMRVDGTPTTLLPDWIDFQGRSETFTRHFNPADVERNTDEFIGVPPGLRESTLHQFNGEPLGGQGRWLHHASMLTRTFMDGTPTEGDLLQSRLLSAAEMNFTLAEMSLNGWNVGNAQTLYENGVKASLEAWELADEYDSFILQDGVAYDGTVEQVLTQKWVASFTSATEAWNDYKRTGLPAMAPLTEAREPVISIRFGYGSDETNNNNANVNVAIDRLVTTEYSGLLGKNSVYSKTWLLQGSNVPY